MLKEIFTDIYNQNRAGGGLWGSKESVSGTGSSLEQTLIVREELQKLLYDLNINSMLDIPCGDFNWMRFMDLGGVRYIGADIVDDIIANNQRFAQSNLSFQLLDVTKDTLPQVDLIMVRDLLGHLPYEDIFATLANIERAKPQHLLVTTFTRTGLNYNISPGNWIPLNLMDSPFDLIPTSLFSERCPQDNGAYSDKSMMLLTLENGKLPRIKRGEIPNPSQ